MRRPCRTTGWSSTISTRITLSHRRHLQSYRGARARARRARRAGRRRRGPLAHRARGRARGRRLGASRASKPCPSSVTSQHQRSVAGAATATVDVARRPRAAARCAAPPGRPGTPPPPGRRQPRHRRRRRTCTRAACTRSSSSTCLRSAASRPSPARSAGRSPTTIARSSSVASAARRCTVSSSRRRPRRVAVDQRRGGVGGQPQAEQLLRHRVVQLAGDPVALLHDGQLPAALVEPGVDQRDRGVRGEQPQQFLVVGGEAARRALVGEEERAEDLVAVQIGMPRKSLSTGCAAGHQPKRGWRADVGQPHRRPGRAASRRAGRAGAAADRSPATARR